MTDEATKNQRTDQATDRTDCDAHAQTSQLVRATKRPATPTPTTNVCRRSFTAMFVRNIKNSHTFAFIHAFTHTHIRTNICLYANVVVTATLWLPNIVVIAEKNCRSECSANRESESKHEQSSRTSERARRTRTRTRTHTLARRVREDERRRRPRCIEILFRYYTAAVVVA